ncbi:energy transducer TonB [Candidatus Latescibacterota bacterium]
MTSGRPALPKRPWRMPLKKYPAADLRRSYWRVLWSCLGIATVLDGALFVLFPTFEVDAMKMEDKPVIIQLEQIPETRQERRPPPPPRPVVPIATDSPDVDDDATIMETDLDFNFDDLTPPPPLDELLGRNVDVEMEEEEEEIVELWRVEKQPVPVKEVVPKYPEVARKAGIEGHVTVLVLISRDGKVEAVGKVIGPEVFHEEAKKAAVHWEFTPAIQNDKPVRVWVSLPFKFQLN